MYLNTSSSCFPSPNGQTALQEREVHVRLLLQVQLSKVFFFANGQEQSKQQGNGACAGGGVVLVTSLMFQIFSCSLGYNLGAFLIRKEKPDTSL